MVLDAGVWGVSVLAGDQVEVSRAYSRRGRPTPDQFHPWTHSLGVQTGCVLLDDALATLECRTTSVVDGGDHVILIGEVLSLATPRPQAEPAHLLPRALPIADLRRDPLGRGGRKASAGLPEAMT